MIQQIYIVIICSEETEKAAGPHSLLKGVASG